MLDPDPQPVPLVRDGVPVILTSGRPGTLDVTLTFGVGLVHESPIERGMAHLVEHLVLGSVRDTPISYNGGVDLETTTFVASGSTRRVVEFLERVCRGLSDLPCTRLEVEKGVLAAEGGTGCHPVAAALLASRYGTSHAGAPYWRGRSVTEVTEEDLRAFARRHFVAGNAVLEVRGDLPEDLRLPLTAGDAPAAAPVHVIDRRGPVVLTDLDLPESGAGVMITLPWSLDEALSAT